MKNKDCLLKECTYTTGRSSGAGGQHVNKTETRVTLMWRVGESACISAPQKELLFTRLKQHISNSGWLQLSEQSTRSQWKNKQLLQKKFVRMIEGALVKQKTRKAVTPTLEQIEKRLHLKHRQSELKRQRRWQQEE